MDNNLSSQLGNLGVALVATFFIWRHYRHRTFGWSERYSTFGPRFWTGFADSCVVWPIGFVTWGLLSFNIPRGVTSFLIIVESLAWLVYTVVMHARYGQTVGKMLTKVRVVDSRTEANISWGQAWLREGLPMSLSLGCMGYEVYLILTQPVPLLAIASGEALVHSRPFWLLYATPGLWFMAELLTMLTNQRRRALYDFIAGTVVVRTNSEERTA